MEAIEHHDVLIVGAGISGVGSAYHLKDQQPDKSFVDEVVVVLQQGLKGVLTLTGPVTQVATLMAKAWRVA